jgi:hypothetical protein
MGPAYLETEVDHDVSRQDEVLEDIVHCGLEHCWRVGKAEVHHQWLKEPPVSTEGGLPLVAFADQDVVEAPPNIEFHEELSSLQPINEVVDQREL